MQSLNEFLPESVSAFLQTPTGTLVLVVTFLVFTLACCRLFSKAGYPGVLGVLMLVPGLNVIVFLAYAFLPWPVQRELRLLRKMKRAVHRADNRQQRRAPAA